MGDESFMYSQKDGEDYVFILNHGGVRTTVGRDYFTLSAEPQGEINEQEAVRHLRDWIRNRKAAEELRESRVVSG